MSSHKKHPITYFRESAEKRQKSLKKAQAGGPMMEPRNVIVNPPDAVYQSMDPGFTKTPKGPYKNPDPGFTKTPSRPYKDPDPGFTKTPDVQPARVRPRNPMEAFPSKMKKGGETKPSAGLSKKTKSNVAKKASAGKDIGKPGKGFAKLAASAGGGDKGKRIAAAAMWKNIKRG